MLSPCRSSVALCAFAVLGLLGIAGSARGAVVPVSTTAQLAAAVSAARPGDVITLAPGTYDIREMIPFTAAGTAAQPITLRAASLGQALLRVDTVEGFRVAAPHWRFENLDMRGVCLSDTDCEHAFHVVGAADFTEIRNCRLHDFNAMIKGNGEGGAFPDDVLIEGCELYDSTVRATANPVTPIDVVGGRRWIVRTSFIHDHAKGQGDGVSYAAFFKGNSSDGLFERNLVVCQRDTVGGVRLGLSFGGGGSGPPSICEGGTCTPEHSRGVMRNNVIVHCSDVGVYLNKSASSRIYNNTLYDTAGIDVRFAESTADVRDHLLSGQIRNRDGGTSTRGSNLELVTALQFAAWFLNPAGADFTLLDGRQLVNLGEPLAQVTDDFCGRLRNDGAPDLGAVEYGPQPCNTSRPTVALALFADGFESGTLGDWLALP